jgi:predicted SAM-dependent methyltransferase
VTEVDTRKTQADLQVNVGCGLSPTPGWLNFDNSPSVRFAGRPVALTVLRGLRLLPAQSAQFAALGRTGQVRFANAAQRIPCTDGSVAAVYSSHMIEHLDRSEARGFLSEVKRVLRPGGVIRIAAPDLSRLVAEYVETGDADSLVHDSHMGLDRPAGLRQWLKWALIGPRHHLWMYDGESLSRLLLEAGYAEATVTRPGLTRIPRPGHLDLRERESETVYVEAVRPR